ncbi:protein piccolo isoform X2 [Rhipicephalus sanguineus]|uniref:protein piccolo isoform X2 n=1 Tax=Rhipicephalus sanguineus TaxID=34632 RepID=UPI0020C42542|nr:protein piccolo isoform X2 [Rhipicephalus sanguineus]
MIPKVVSAISILWMAGVFGAARPTQLNPYNSECIIRFPVSETKNCRPVRYYYNNETGICQKTCSQDAPFSTRNECAMICRSSIACFLRRRRQRCYGRRKVVVFRFDVYRRKCDAKKGCSYRGNNFPTLKECTSTCGAGVGSTEVSAGDEEGESSLEHQTHEQGPVPQLPGPIQAIPTSPIRPEVPNIGRPPSIPQLPTAKPLLLGVPALNPAQKPVQPSDTRILSEVPQRDQRCAITIPNTTRTCNTSKLYFDQNKHLCRVTCSDLAPFESRSECNSVCRSAVVCFDKSQPELCKTNNKNIAFYFDSLKGKCYARTVCSYSGNNFPTIQECKDTCNPYAGYRGSEEVIKESSVVPSNIGPSQPVNKGVGEPSPTSIPQVEKAPPVATPSTRVPPSAGPVLTPPILRLHGVSDAAVTLLIAQKDPMCRISHLKFAASNCKHHYYYFNQVSRLCKPTCSETAPFAARSACDKICRSAVVCFYQREEEEEDCDVRHKATVFSFEPRKGICIKRRSCSTRGNNFPSLRECKLTCATYTGFQGTAKVDADKPNVPIAKEPPQLPPQQHPTEKPPNIGLLPAVPGSVPPLPSDTGRKPALPQQDHRCTITVFNVNAKGCETPMYYFDSRTHLCDPTCSSVAPFQSRSECVGICRSVTGIEEPGEEDSSKVIPEISTKPTKEQPKGPETQPNPISAAPAPTKPPSAAPPTTGAASRPGPSVAGVHEPAQVDSGTGFPTASSPTPSQEVPTPNQTNTPTVLPSLPQTPMQQPVVQQEVNPPKVSPMQQYIKQQESNMKIGSTVTERPSKQQVTTAVPAQLPSSMPQKQTSILPSASQVQKETLAGPMESQKYAQVPKSFTQQTSSGAPQINQNLNEISQPAQVVSQMHPQATEQRPITIIASPSNQQLLTQQQPAIAVVPNPYPTQDVNNQMFSMYPRPLLFGYR